jgi:hypothetical protein
MKTHTSIEQFNDWSARWKAERKENEVLKIVNLWQQPLPRDWEREIWKGKLGYRKRSENKGEQFTEKGMFNEETNGFKLMFADNEPDSEYRIEAIYHNMPLANQRKGQVIADVFGVLQADERVRPLLIEVKVTANDPWFALVENLQQIRLARACAHKIQEFVQVNSKHRIKGGVWGLIIAPGSYYEKHLGSLAKCKSLLHVLKKNTRARVAFGISDSLATGQIKIIADNWLPNQVLPMD